MIDIIEMLLVFFGVTVILLISVGLPLKYYATKKRIEEEHKTNNLALAYQILSARKEVTMEEVKQLIILSGSQPTLPSDNLSPDQMNKWS